jgi:hypothetical protein
MNSCLGSLKHRQSRMSVNRASFIPYKMLKFPLAIHRHRRHRRRRHRRHRRHRRRRHRRRCRHRHRLHFLNP